LDWLALVVRPWPWVAVAMVDQAVMILVNHQHFQPFRNNNP
jgi:hypothetical protein